MLFLISGSLMISTIRFTSFKSVGAGRRLSPRHVIFVIALFGLIYQYSQWVLLGLVVWLWAAFFLPETLPPVGRQSGHPRAIADDGSVKDEASPLLRRVRRDLRGATGELVALLTVGVIPKSAGKLSG